MAFTSQNPLAKLGALARGLKPGGKVMGFRDGKAETARVLSVMPDR